MPASWRACDNPPAGYSIGYPGDWYAAEGAYECQFFHPEPFTIPANSEFPPLALNAAQSDATVAAYRTQVTDPMYYTVVRDEAVTVLDRPLQSEGAYWLVWPPERAEHPPLVAFRDWLVGEAANG